MAKIKTIELSEEQQAALEKAWRYAPSSAFRQRCQMILLKARRLSSKEVASQVGCCEPVVNTWFARYQAQGMEGLKTRQGQGRRAILQEDTDLEAVRRAVQENRQRVSLARAELEQELGKGFSTLTLKRFLKKTAAASSAFDGG